MRAQPGPLTRRRAGTIMASLGLALLGGCGTGGRWHGLDVSGSSPALRFAMTRAADAKPVTEADYRGQIVLLDLGYTFCPDVCPDTLTNLDAVLKRLGPAAREVRVLFVTVDPDRDTLPVLGAYAKQFGPQIDGLRGTPDQLASLARRYRLLYSVTTASGDRPYAVAHSSGIYVFDRSGAARLLLPSLGSAKPDIAGTAADLGRLIAEKHPPGLLARLFRAV